MDRNTARGAAVPRLDEASARELLDALVERRPLRRGTLEVDVREAMTGRHPLTGEEVSGAPVAALWDSERLLAVLISNALAVARFVGNPRTRWMLGRAAEEAGLAVVPTAESSLWRLLGCQRPD